MRCGNFFSLVKLQIPCVGEQNVVISDANVSTEIFLEDFEKKSSDFSLSVQVLGDNSKVSVVGNVLAEEKTKKNWSISVALLGKNQSGKLVLHGIADDAAEICFDGAGILGKNSENGTLRVEEKVVLFSKNSRAKTIPVLRVETEDVLSASHSASVAPFSEEIFFFLESRGIDPREAKNLLKEGFLRS